MDRVTASILDVIYEALEDLPPQTAITVLRYAMQRRKRYFEAQAGAEEDAPLQQQECATLRTYRIVRGLRRTVYHGSTHGIITLAAYRQAQEQPGDR